MSSLKLEVEFDREEDGRWIAEVVDRPGVMVYGATMAEAFGAPRPSRCGCSPTAWRRRRIWTGWSSSAVSAWAV